MNDKTNKKEAVPNMVTASFVEAFDNSKVKTLTLQQKREFPPRNHIPPQKQITLFQVKLTNHNTRNNKFKWEFINLSESKLFSNP